MGHFYFPPPPVISATGAQPYAPNKLPPSIIAVPVNNPPFKQQGRSQAVVSETATIAQPDPWQYNNLLGGLQGLQPYGARQLPPSVMAVPVNNPPFENPSRTAALLATTVAAWQPAYDPWQYNYLGGRQGEQPYGNRQLTPSTQAVVVNTPPFVTVSRQVAQQAITAAASQPAYDPWQYNFLGGREGRQPYGQRQLPPSTLDVPVNNPPGVGFPRFALIDDPPPILPRWLTPTVTGVRVDKPPGFRFELSGILRSWQPPDPNPTLPKVLSPGIPGQSVDNPPGRFTSPQPVLVDQLPPPQTLPYFPQSSAVVAVVQVVYAPQWLATVIQSWQPTDPQPTLPRKLPPQITAVPVDQPPFVNEWLDQAQGVCVLAWQPPDPPPTIPRKLSPGIPGQSADQPPFVNEWLDQAQGQIVISWQPVDPPLQQQRKLSPGIPGQSVDNPPGLVPRQLPYPADAPPVQLPRYVPPQQVVVVAQSPFAQFWLVTVLQAWVPPDPPPQQRGPLNPSITAVPVNNPPFARSVPQPPYPSDTPYIQLLVHLPPQQVVVAKGPFAQFWLATVLQSWVPVDPQPQQGRKLNPSLTAVATNNPPFGGNKFFSWGWGAPDVITQSGGAFIQSVDNPPGLVRYWLDPIIRAWQPLDPPPQQRGPLNPAITAVRVDNPPGIAFPIFVITDDPPPILPRYIVQPFTVTVAKTPYLNAWLASVVQSWQPPDPLPTLPRWLNPSITAVRVDNPPRLKFDLSGTLRSWQPPDPQPQQQGKLSPGIPGQSVDNPPGLLPRQITYQIELAPLQPVRYVPQVTTTTVQGPYSNLWLSTVLFSWQPVDPLPLLPRKLPPQITAVSVDNPPPFKLFTPYPLGPDPLPILGGKLSPGVPGQSVDNPPRFKPFQPIITTVDPLPTLIGKLSPGIPGQSVDNPPTLRQFIPVSYPQDVPPQQQSYLVQPFVSTAIQVAYTQSWLSTVLGAWQPLDPPPQQKRPLSPALTAVRTDNPPGFRFELSGILRSWQPPDPPPVQRGPLNPAILAVPVNNPPFHHYGRLQREVFISWIDPPPQPIWMGPFVVQPGITPVVTDLHDHPFFATFGKMSVH